LNCCYTTNLNEEPGIRLFWTTLQLIATSGTHRVLEYSIRYSTEYSSSKTARFAQPYWAEYRWKRVHPVMREPTKQ